MCSLNEYNNSIGNYSVYYFYFVADDAKIGLVETRLAIIPGGGEY